MAEQVQHPEAVITGVKALAWRVSMDLRERMEAHLPDGGLFVSSTPDEARATMRVLDELSLVYGELVDQAEELVEQLAERQVVDLRVVEDA